MKSERQSEEVAISGGGVYTSIRTMVGCVGRSLRGGGAVRAAGECYNCGIGGWEGVNMVREEWGVDGISETRGSRAHFRSKYIPPKHTKKVRSPRFARARGYHPTRDSHLS